MTGRSSFSNGMTKEHIDSLTTLFNVQHQPCMLFYIKVVQGYHITKGWAKDLLDVPDPYVSMSIKASAQSVQKTTTKDNDINPIWNETFKFYLDPQFENILNISLYDANYLVDELLSSQTITISELPVFQETVKQRLTFSGNSEVDIEMWAEYSNDPQLRFSLSLCEEEKTFIEKRKQKVFEAMQEILGDDAPTSPNETPVIGVMGSGGGFRATTAFCGVMSGLVDSKIMDMVTYNVGLSGSAWYLSTLYSHPDWPEKSPRQLQGELRESLKSGPLKLLNPTNMMKYLARLYAKKREGQPVSITDLYGHFVGGTFLKGRLESKLTDQQEKLKDGNIPMPMYSCLHVKKHVSALVFHEWMEFSPYEIGMPKYGTFMKPELFGSKFFIGHLVKKFAEPPLHFLQGIWGSFFCLQFKRLLQNDLKTNQPQGIEQARKELEQELSEEMSFHDSDSSDTEIESDNAHMNTDPKPQNGKGNDKINNGDKSDEAIDGVKKEGGNSVLSSWFGSYLANHPLSKSIDGRAACMHNFMRGLSLYKASAFSPFRFSANRSEDKLTAESCIEKQEDVLQPDLSKTTSQHDSEATSQPEDSDDFDGIFEMYPTSIKKMFVVDGGLSFNSPYPLLLRPQRGVDLILSFDFSARETEAAPPFTELMLAMKWARLNNVPFPNIDPTVIDREGQKECYVFENPNDPRCPIVIHFVLINITFREEKYPGVRRTTKEEKEFGDFDIFEDPNKPYSTFNLKYTKESFNRLVELTEFNIKLYQGVILENIKKCIRRIQDNRAKKSRQYKLMDIKKLNLTGAKEES